jgi:hypothetical protein
MNQESKTKNPRTMYRYIKTLTYDNENHFFISYDDNIQDIFDNK